MPALSHPTPLPQRRPHPPSAWRTGSRTPEAIAMKTLKDIERRLAESVLARDAVQPLFDEPPKGVLSDLDRLPELGRTSGFYAVPERAVPGYSRVAGGN